MSFSSIDDLIAEISAGKFYKSIFRKSSNNAAALAAGYWAEAFQWTGLPAQGVVSGTAGTGVQLNSSTTGALYSGGNVSPDTKHLLNILGWTPTTTMCPATIILCDFLTMYPSLVVTGTPTTISGVALPRYATGDGVEMICSVAGAQGAASPALTFTYNDGSTNRVAAAHTAPGNSAPLSALYVTDGSPFVRKVGPNATQLVSYTLASGTSGSATVFFVKPLAQIPLLALNTPSERDYVYQLPSLPKIEDDACLGYILNVGGAMIANAKLDIIADFAWG